MIYSPSDLKNRVNSVLDSGGLNTVAEVRETIQDTIDSVGNGRAFIRAKDDVNHGVEVHYPKADTEWLLKAEAGSPPTPAHILIRGETAQATNYLTVTLPDIFARLDGHQNDFDLAVVLGNTTVAAAVAAHVDLWFTSDARRGVTFTHNTAGAGGNDFVVSVTYQTFAYPSARYVSATELNITTGESGTIQGIINAVNAARHNGNQLITATDWNDGASHNIGLIPNGRHHLSGGLNQSTTSREPLSFEYAGRNDGSGNPRTREFLLTALATDTLAEIKTVIEGLRYGGGTPFSNKVVLSGSGTDTISSVILPSNTGHTNAEVEDFFGGVDSTVTVVVDDNEKTVTVTYAVGFHYLADLIDSYASGVNIRALSNTNTHQLAEGAKSVTFDVPQQLAPGPINSKLLWSGNYAISVANQFERSTSTKKLYKSDFDISDNVLWLVTAVSGPVAEGAAGDIWGFIQPSQINEAENQEGLGTSSSDSVHNIVAGFINMLFAWDDSTDELLFASSNNAVDPNPLRIYQLEGLGQKGEKGDAGENALTDTFEAEYWQNSSETGNPPNNVDTKEIVPNAGLFLIEFEALRGNRYVHFRVPIGFELVTAATDNLNRLNTFTVVTTATHRTYHSRRVTDNGVLEFLVEATDV